MDYVSGLMCWVISGGFSRRPFVAVLIAVVGLFVCLVDGKAPQKRKLSQASPNGSKMAIKNKADYVPPSSKKRKINRSNRDQVRSSLDHPRPGQRTLKQEVTHWNK